MRIGSLFSGVGGLELGLEWALAPHARTVWQVEKEEFCREVLSQHWPEAQRFEDVRTVGAHNLAPVDLVCGGFPCQDISAAGKGDGLDGDRSGLWWEFERVVRELEPRWVVVENVNSGAKRWVDAVRGSLGKLGYETLPIPLAACDVGAPHLRRRIFIVAHSERFALRDEWERRSARWARTVCPPGDAQSPHARQAGALAHGNGGGCQSVRLTPERGEQGEAGSLAHGRSGPRPERPRGPAQAPGATAWTAQPGVGGVAHGLSTRVDRSRLQALGNAVVPQCAQVVGEIIRIALEPSEGV